MANNDDPDQTSWFPASDQTCSIASDLGLDCLLKLVCLISYDKYGRLNIVNVSTTLFKLYS